MSPLLSKTSVWGSRAAGSGIGYEDLKVIEDYEFLSSVAAGRPHVPGFAEAIDYVSVQDALLRSWRSEKWEPVTRLA